MGALGGGSALGRGRVGAWLGLAAWRGTVLTGPAGRSVLKLGGGCGGIGGNGLAGLGGLGGQRGGRRATTERRVGLGDHGGRGNLDAAGRSVRSEPSGRGRRRACGEPRLLGRGGRELELGGGAGQAVEGRRTSARRLRVGERGRRGQRLRLDRQAGRRRERHRVVVALVRGHRGRGLVGRRRSIAVDSLRGIAGLSGRFRLRDLVVGERCGLGVIALESRAVESRRVVTGDRLAPFRNLGRALRRGLRLETAVLAPVIGLDRGDGLGGGQPRFRFVTCPASLEGSQVGRPRRKAKRCLVQQNLKQVPEPVPCLWLGGLVTGLRWRDR